MGVQGGPQKRERTKRRWGCGDSRGKQVVQPLHGACFIHFARAHNKNTQCVLCCWAFLKSYRCSKLEVNLFVVSELCFGPNIGPGAFFGMKIGGLDTENHEDSENWSEFTPNLRLLKTATTSNLLSSPEDMLPVAPKIMKNLMKIKENILRPMFCENLHGHFSVF